MNRRELHEELVRRVEAELSGRPWSWLAQETAIPQSTLAGQVSRRRFSLDALLRIAQALGCPLAHFIPGESDSSSPPPPFQEAVRRLDAAVRDLRNLAG